MSGECGRYADVARGWWQVGMMLSGMGSKGMDVFGQVGPSLVQSGANSGSVLV